LLIDTKRNFASAYVSYTDTYDSNGVQTSSVGILDNGKTWSGSLSNGSWNAYTSYDSNGDEGWSRIDYANSDPVTGEWETISVQQRDGTRDETVKDLHDRVDWSQVNRHWDAAAQLASEVVTNDVSNDVSWLSVQRTIDAVGRIATETDTGENGTVVHIETQYANADRASTTISLTSEGGHDVAITDDGLNRAVYIEGTDKPLLYLNLTDADDVSVYQTFFNEKAAEALIKSPNPYTRALGLAIIAGVMLYEYYSSGSEQPETTPISPVPPGIPNDAQFVFGVDGVNYYMNKFGQIWEDGPQGIQLRNMIPNQSLGTDALGACTWTFHNEAAPDASKLFQQQITGLP
jgi:hypothetical protein